MQSLDDRTTIEINAVDTEKSGRSLEAEESDEASESLSDQEELPFEEECPICLQSLFNESIARVDLCLHGYCLDCILRWSRSSRYCPMCKQGPFRALIHAIRSDQDYDRMVLDPLPFAPSAECHLATEDDVHLILRQRRERVPEPPPNHERAFRMRQRIYRKRLWARPVHTGAGPRLSFNEQSPLSDAQRQRLIKWARRDVQALVGKEIDVELIVRVLDAVVCRHGINSQESMAQLRPFLDDRTNHFIHECVGFLRSALAMEAYDAVVDYRQD